jgi:hypothetical protein
MFIKKSHERAEFYKNELVRGVLRKFNKIMGKMYKSYRFREGLGVFIDFLQNHGGIQRFL